MSSGRAPSAGSPARDRAHDVFGDGGPLDAMFNPKTVALFGDASRPGSAAHRVLAALTGSQFEGSLVNVDPEKQANAFGVPSVASLEELPRRPDLALLADEALNVDDVIDRCGAVEVRALAVLSARHDARDEFERDVCERLHQARMRMIGPGCAALMNPSLGLNASLGLPMAVAGTVAFIGQSGSLAAAILDWSRSGIVGFSAFVSVGGLVDVGWGNLIDYFGSHSTTRTIVVQIESIANARSLLSAAREVALQKPIIVLKSGRTPAAVRAFTWHGQPRFSDDEVLDAALRRVGVLRVEDFESLFYTADALSKQRRPKGPRLAVVSNAGGPGVIAADQVVIENGSLVESADETLLASSAASPANAMDVLGDGTSEPFLTAVHRAIANPNSDGVLVVVVPAVLSDPETAIHGLVAMHPTKKPVLLRLPERGELSQHLKRIASACFPVLPSARAAARTFNLMWRYADNLYALYETPELYRDVSDQALRDRVTPLVDAARSDGRDLTNAESIDVLRAYDFAIDESGQPHDGYELQIGSRIDPEFGPVLWCGAGGRLGELFPQRVIGLPPLNATLARLMLERSALFDGLQSLAVRGALSLTDLDAALVRLSQLVIEQPGIRQIEINPLIVSAEGTRVANARIAVHAAGVDIHGFPPAFRPYPLQYVSEWTTPRGETVTIRPIRAEDEPLMVRFHEQLSERSVYQRYFQMLRLDRRTAHDALMRVCFVDYDRELALVVEGQVHESADRSIVAVGTLTKLHRQRRGEVSVMVRDDFQRRGLGHELVRRLLDFARDEHLAQVIATTMVDNAGMCAVFRKLGFTLDIDADQTVLAKLSL